MNKRPPFTQLVQALPATVPFVGPKTLERLSGRPFRLRLGANESVFGISPLAWRAMQEALEQIGWYGDPESYELRSQLANIHAVMMENLVVGSGIDDLLGLIVRAFITQDDVVVTSLGAYPTFNYHVSGYGGQLQRVPYRAGYNDLQALADAASRVNARLVYLANPDNPTGTWHDADQLQAFINLLPSDCLLVLDEAYVEFAPRALVLPINVANPHVIRLRTFSKAHGMAGARIGYAISDVETISAFEKIRLHFGVNLIAQAGALASLYDMDFVQGVVQAVEDGRRDYALLAQAQGLSSLPSSTNFVAIDMGSSDAARAMVGSLAEQGVFVRMPGAPSLDRYIRVTVGTRDERALFAEIFRGILNDAR
jgi:histidinol-phosphate aminotransferase